jgi:hypothetical protein
MRHFIFIRTLSSCALLCTVASALPVRGEPASSTPPQASVPCEDGTPHATEGDSLDNPCEPAQTFGAKSPEFTLRHEEEKGGFRWHALTPQEQDQRLLYYPGAPRPLWGY